MQKSETSSDLFFHKERCFRITATDVAVIFDIDPYRKLKQMIEEKNWDRQHPFEIKEVPKNLQFVFDHGNRGEIISANWYFDDWDSHELFDPKKEITPIYTNSINRIWVHESYPWLVATPDREIWTHPCVEKDPLKVRLIRLVEFKTPLRKIHITVPPHYWLQCQMQMEVCNVDLLHFVSRTPRSKWIVEERLFIAEVKRDKKFIQEEVIPALYDFYCRFKMDAETIEAYDKAKHEKYLEDYHTLIKKKLGLRIQETCKSLDISKKKKSTLLNCD